eukprot:8744337-Lingulodinium_polyedra.AAC.1
MLERRAHHSLGAVASPKTPFLISSSCPGSSPGSPSRGCSINSPLSAGRPFKKAAVMSPDL